MLNELQAEAHYKGIGGSMASAILGLDKYCSNVEAYLALTDEEFRKERQSDISRKLVVNLGKVIEPVIIEQVASEKGWKIKPISHTFYDGEFDFLRGNPDAIIEDKNEVVEIKTRGNYSAKNYGDEGSDQVLDTDFIQCQHYMMIGGFQKAHLVCLVMGTSEIKYYEVLRNDEVIATMRQSLVDFWKNHVEKKIPPAPLTYEDALAIYPKHKEGAKMIATPDLKEAIQKALKLKEEAEKVEEELNAIKAKIAFSMQNNSVLIDEEGNPILTFNSFEQNRIDTDALKKAGLYERFSKKTSSRKMLFK